MDVFDATIWEQLPRLRRQQDDAIAALRGEDKGDLQLFWDAAEAFFAQLEDEVVDEIKKLHGPEFADEDQLKVLAWTLGIRQPDGVAVPYLRRWLAEGAVFRQWKGNYDNLQAAIFLATGIPVQVELPFEGVWTVGVSEVGGPDPIGSEYKREPTSTFIVGETILDDNTTIGSQAINEELPFTVELHLFYDPGPEALAQIRWAARQVLRAVDLIEFVIPDSPDAWVLGYSKLGTGTRLSGGCFIVGESYLDESTICGPDVASERIILPDGSTIAET